MTEPAIGVVIATYNRSRLLHRAIRSVQNQTYKNVVITVYDNASTDDTQRVVAEIAQGDARIRYHRHDRNIGGAQNFLYGLRRVETPLFFLLSDDDVVLPHFFETAASWFERYPDARFVAGGTLEARENGQLIFAPQAFWPRDGYFQPPDGLGLMLTGFHPSWNTIIFRREVLTEVGEFNSSILNVSDIDFTLRIATRYPYVVFREPSGIFVRHAASGGEFADASVIAQYETMAEELLKAPNISEDAKALVNHHITRQMAKRIIQIAVKQLLKLQPVEAFQTLQAYHRRYARTPLSVGVDLTARAGMLCPPLLRIFPPLEALRGRMFANINERAARGKGIRMPTRAEYASYLRLN